MTDAPSGTVAAMPVRRGAVPRQTDLLVCLSHLRWNFVFQRPQHLLSRAARGMEVLFFEEPIIEAGATPRLDLHATPEGVTVGVPILPEGMDHAGTIAAQRVLLEQALAARAAPARRVIAWFYTPMALEFADGLRADLTVYDCMDELSLFRGAPPRLVQLEQRLIDQADLVFTGGRSLYEAKRDRHSAVHCFPSSIDAAHFGAARGAGLDDPPGQAGIAHPRIGFFGVIDERMDIDLVDAIAAARPDWQLVMIGPVVKIDPASLPRRPNIHWLGGRKYDELPAHLAHWDAGFMPFALNESTRFISPTKTPEFLAAGLPVVSTPITDVVRDWGPEGEGLVEIAGDAAGFVRALAPMLDGSDRAAWRARVDSVLARQSWDMTWSAMHALMEAALAEMPSNVIPLRSAS